MSVKLQRLFGKLTGDRLTVFVLDDPGSGIRLPGFRFINWFAVRCVRTRGTVRRLKTGSVSRGRWRWIFLCPRVFFVKTFWRDSWKWLMRHSHITFTDVQGFHKLLRSPVQIFQRNLSIYVKCLIILKPKLVFYRYGIFYISMSLSPKLLYKAWVNILFTLLKINIF